MSNYVFLVIGTLPDGDIGALWVGGDEGSGMEPHPTINPGGGGGVAPPAFEFTHTETCNDANGAAAQVAGTIMATDDMGPDEFDWTNAEFVATIVERQPGVFGAYNDKVYSDGSPDGARSYTPDATAAVAGIVHNHPLSINNGEQGSRLKQRYPSGVDWAALDRLNEKYGSGIIGYNPSAWIIDSFGATRKFSRSDKPYFDSLSENDREAGLGLQGREVNDDDC